MKGFNIKSITIFTGVTAVFILFLSNNHATGITDRLKNKIDRKQTNTIVMPRPETPSKPTIGKPIPNFSMNKYPNGNLTNKELIGKVILIDFFATWCGPCKAAISFMEELHKKYNAKGLYIIGANTYDDNLTARNQFLRDSKIPYQLTVNNEDLMDEWGLSGVPQFVLINTKGIVCKIYSGFSDSRRKPLEEEILKLLPLSKTQTQKLTECIK